MNDDDREKLQQAIEIITEVADDIEGRANNLEDRFPSKAEELVEQYDTLQDILSSLEDLKGG